ncbi:sex peptide receptor-like [Ylistrum balloti]|uniref:sex peptide receptor-like n=1 Tax=Ylistrum balloti TaxID=509963 RepID=UPI0029059CE8|nr:sex peptide receptor-like [Ylistrum balloti]
MNTSKAENGTLVEEGCDYCEYPPDIVEIHVAASFIVPMMGYAYPILALLTILTNVMVVVVFTMKIRTPTSIILVALALSDTLTCLCMLPDSVYFYTLKNYQTYVPFGWCVYRQYIVAGLYRVMRTCSNWITLMLGLQRYVIVRLPFKANRICTARHSVLACIAACVIAIIIHLNLFLIFEVKPFPVSSETNETLENACYLQVPEYYIQSVEDIGKAIWMYFIISGIFSRFLPCLLLLIFTCLLVFELRKSQQLISNACENALSKRNNQQITQSVVAVLLIFLISELHDAVAFGIYAYEIASDRLASVLTENVDAIWDYVGVMLSLVGFQCNFWIYLLMSSLFRSAMKNICSLSHRRQSETTMLSYLQENRSLIKVTKTSSDK